MRTSNLCVLGALTLCLSSCAFLIDFDELQKGDEVATGGTGGGGTGGTGGTASCDQCDDGDPCTVDTCDFSGDKPVCTNTRRLLAPDGFSYSEEYDALHNINLTTVGPRFYLSTFFAEGDRDDIALSRFQREGEGDFTKGPTFATLSAGTSLASSQPVSDAAMLGVSVVSSTIIGFVALQSGAAMDAQVYALQFDGDMTLQMDGVGPIGAPTYAIGDKGRRPVAWESQGDLNVAWVTRLGATVNILADGALPQVYTIGGVQGIAPLDTSAGPGLLIGTANGMGAYFGGATGTSVPVSDCTGGGTITGMGSTRLIDNLAGGWFAWWTRVRDGEAYTSDAAVISCAPTGCSVDDCGPSRPPDIGTLHHTFDWTQREFEPGIFDVVSVLPIVSGNTSRVDINLSTLDLGDEPTQLAEEQTRLESSPVNEGVMDRAAIATSGDIVAAAWIRHGASKDTLRVERFRKCPAN